MKKKNSVFVVVAITLIGIMTAYIYAAGTAEDPLISLSYLNSVLLPQIESRIDQRVKAATSDELEDAVAKAVEERLSSFISDGGGEISLSAGAFETVQLLEGQSLTAREGSVEVLLRRGIFHCIDPEGQGITNMTAGTEVRGGSTLTLQNLYLIPRADGRGIVCDTQEGWVLVRGSFLVSGGINQADHTADTEASNQEDESESED